jgi:hypothetical protein
MAEMAPGIIDEHQPRQPDNAGPEQYTPTPEEKKAIKLAYRLFEKARKHRAQYDEKWLDYYRMFRGRQWSQQRPTYRHSEVINLIFRTIQSTVPIQTDMRPKFEFLPKEPSDLEVSEILNETLESDWASNNWSSELLEVIYDANIYGTGLAKMTYDPEAGDGMGNVVFASLDPLCCYPDPDARDTNKQCDFFVYAEPVDVRKIKRKYKEHKDFIKSDLADLSKGSKTDLGPLKLRSPVESRVMYEEGSLTELADKEKALVITVWMTPEFCKDDYEEKEKPTGELDPETGAEKVVFEQIAKYPRGRKIVLCNGVLLEDGDAGYDDGKIPYLRLQNYVLPREFWGMSEVEQLEGPQKTFNKLVSFALDVLTLMGNPIWLVHGSSGLDPETIRSQPGAVYEWDGEPGTKPERIEGVGLQPYVLQMIDKMAEWFDSVGGSQDVSRGVQPTGITAASAISSLQEAAQTRLRQKSRNADAFLQDAGQLYLSRVLQFYTVPRIFRLTGNQGVQKYFRMQVEQYPKMATEQTVDPLTGQPVQEEVPTGEMGTRMNVQPFLSDPLTGKPTGKYNPLDGKQYEIMGKFDVTVATGTNLPFAKAEKEQRLFNLFDRQLIDQEEVLKGLDVPNAEAIIQRMQMAAQQAALAQQQAAMAPETAPPAA